MASDAAFATVTNIKTYLKNSMTTSDTDITANKGVIVNLDVLANLKNMANEVKIYIWIINNDAAAATLKVKGCATSACANITADFSVDVGGAKAQDANKVIVQEISLVKNSDGTIKLMLNGDSTNAKDLWHDATNNKLWVQFTFLTSLKIKFTTFQLFIKRKSNTSNLLIGTGTCTLNSQCLPGFSCADSACVSKCDITCNRCKDSSTLKTQCETCSPLSKIWSTGPTANICDNNDHVDFSLFGDIEFSIPAAHYRSSNTFSIGFWMFLQDKSLMGNNLVNVILSQFMMISVGIDADKLTTWCNPYLHYYNSIESTISKSNMDTITSNTKYSTMKASTATYTDASWVYTRCAVNLDGQSAYNLIDNTKMVTSVVTEKATLGMANYYESTPVDYPYKYFYGDNQYLRIKNAGSLTTSTTKSAFIIRGLTVFSEFIPKTSQLQYFNFSLMLENSNFPGLYIAMNPEWSAVSKALTGYYYNSSGIRTILSSPTTTFVTNYDKFSSLPTGFFRLNLATPNTYWGNSELIYDSSKTLTCETNSFCFLNTKQINCPSNKYLVMTDNTCAAACPGNTLPSYGTFRSAANVSTGFCTNPCDAAPNANSSCTVTLSNFFTSFACKTNFTKSHMTCIDDTNLEKGALHYSGYFGTPAKITIPVTSISNYFVEFWIYIDKVYNPTPVNASTNQYIWYTNAIGIIRKNNDKATYQIIGPNGTLYSTTFTLEYGQWYKMAYYTNNRDVTLIYNRKTPSDKTFTYASNLPLTNIYFCHNSTCGPINSTITWASGYYRNLRVWSGDYMSLSLFKSLDQYWSFLNTPTVRFSALKIFYPFNIKYSKEKLLRDPDTTPTGDISPTGTVDPYQPWNYSITFDQTTANNYISAFTTSANGLNTPTNTPCGANCKSCNALECYECAATHILTAGDCVQKTNAKYFLVSPGFAKTTINPADISYRAVTGVTTSFTVSFFVKMLGWKTSSSTFDIFKYGTGMKLTYDITNNNLNLTDGSTNFASVSNFLSLFGTWINISFSYFYDSTKNSSYPAMMNFQVNFENKQISGNFENKSINLIAIPKESIGLYAKIWVSPVYMTGSWGEISNKGRTFAFTKYIDGGSAATDCVTASDLSTDVDFKCVMDHDDVLDELANWCASTYSFVNKSSPFCKTAVSTCKYGFYTSASLCSCPSDATIKDVFPTTNSGDNKCKTHDYFDFGQTTSTTISTVGVSATDYTIEFWVYINNYVASSYTTGFDIKWNKQMMIKLKYENSNYVSICYPLYDSADNTKENANKDTLQISHRAWVYIRCSVSNTQKKYFHFKEDIVVNQLSLSGTAPTVGTDTTLVFTNNSINKGILYFKQFRLWKCYRCQFPDTYKFDITSTTIANYSDLLSLWDPTYSSGTYPPQVTDLKGAKNFTPVVDASWTGYNIVNLSNYKVLSSSNDLCSETSQSCTGLIRLNEINDVSISALPSTTGRYTIELWVMVTSLSNLSNGFHVIWRNVVSLSFSKSTSEATTFNTYCWPFDYLVDNSNLKGNLNIENQAKTKLNDKFAKTSYTDGNWFSVRCAVSSSINQFYINTNTIQDIQSNLMWKNQRTDIPFRYFWQNGAKTNLIVTGANLNTSTNIHIRQIMLYNDYLPPSYAFQNHDMSRLSSANMRSQIFSISFFQFWKQLNTLFFTDDATTDLIYTPTVYQSGSSLGYTKNLPVQVHCEPTKNQKVANGSCTSISSCVTGTLNAVNCQDESTPLNCADTYHWDETKFKASAATACTQVCTASYTRSPDSSTKSAICNFKCDVNSVCPSLAADHLDLPNKFTCKTGYDKVGYRCLDSATSTKSQLYFNGCFNFPNINFDFKSGAGTKFELGHTIQFWMKIDRINEFCTTNKRKYYFILEPHSIYLDTDSKTFAQNGKLVPGGFYNIVYENISSPALKGTLYSINLNTWNVITIQVNLVNRSLRVYSNYNLFAPDIKIDNISDTVKLDPTKLVFCSVQGQSSDNTLCSSATYASNLSWGAAFYKDIKIWDGVNANPWVIQESDNKIFSETLNTYLFYFPMNAKNSLANNIQNTLVSGSGMDYSTRYSTLTQDKDLVINYSSKLEFTDLNSGQFMNSLELTSGDYSSSSCPSNCTRCTFNTPQACLECATGYKMFSNMCKKYTGYYVKIPVSTPKTFLSLRNQDTNSSFTLSNEKNLTWTIWIKYFGQISSTAYCITIIRLKADGSRYICYNPSTRILYFYDGTNILYQDTTFNSFIGQWVLISFSTFVNDFPIIPNLGDYFNYQYAFYVQDQEVSKLSTYSMPRPGINFDVFDIGYDFSGLVADFRLYRNFIVNPYGYIFNSRRVLDQLLYLPLSGEKSTDACLNDQNLNINSYKNSVTVTPPNISYYQQLGVSCVNDYNPYVAGMCQNNSFFDYTKLNTMDLPCNQCASNCSGACGYADSVGCTCDFNEAKDWLRIDSTTKKLSCETPPYVDYSRGSINVNNVKVANNAEYSIEFWFYIYSYNNSTIAFDSHEVIWDLHNYIKIYKNEQNGISVRCSPVYDNRNRSIYVGTDILTLFGPSDYGYDDFYVNSTTNSNDGFSIGSYYKWVYVQCSSSVPRKIYQVNQKVPFPINYKDENIPNLKLYNSTTLTFQPGNKAKANYGFLFFREIKLWSQYDIRHFWTNCKPMGTTLQYYNFTLLHYFKNDNTGVKMTDSLNTNVNGFLAKRPDFIGFNIISLVTKNSTIFPDLDECSEMNIFPTTGFTNSTTFSIQSREIQQVLSSTYKFYYRIKDRNEEIQMGDVSNSRETNYKFNIPTELFGTQVGAISNDTLLIDVFCDINFLNGRKITLYKSLILYKELRFDSGLTFDKLLSNADLNDQITNNQILSRAEVLNDLQTDLKVAFTQDAKVNVKMNFTGNSTYMNQTQNNSIYAKSFVDNPTCTTYTNYCNDRGMCYNVGVNLFCKCQKDYSGQFCQLSRNNSETWRNISNTLVDMFTYRTSNTSTFKVDQNLVNSITTIFSSSSKLIDVGDTKQVVSLKNLMNTLSTTTSSMSKEIIKNSMNDFINIGNTMFKTNLKNYNQQKYNTINNMILNSNNSSNASTLKNINLKIEYFNSKSLPSTNKRILQQTIDTSILTDPNMDYVLNFDDSSDEIPLTNDQLKFYTQTIVEVKNYIQTMLMVGFNSTNYNEPFEYIYKYDEFHVIANKITDLQNFDFKAYFRSINRTANYDAYFDAGDCLREFVSNSTLNNNMYDSSRILMIYIESKIPERNIKLQNKGSYISTSHTIKFFDSNLKEIKLKCNKGIIHHLPLRMNLKNSLGQEWINDYTQFVEKYTADNYYKQYFVAPYYIHANGTIDHSLLSDQLKRYYRNYNIRILYFNDASQSYQYDGISFTEVNPEGYLVGKSVHLSEFTSALYFEPVALNYENHYFMKYMPIYTCMDNIKENMCFYIVVIFFGLHIIILLGISCLQFILFLIRKENLSVSFQNEYNNFMLEKNKDNSKFGDYRHEPNSDGVFQQTERKQSNYSQNNNVIALEDEKEGDFDIAPQKLKISVKNDKGESESNSIEREKEGLAKHNSNSVKLQLKDAVEDRNEKMSIDNIKPSDNEKVQLNVLTNKEDAKIDNIDNIELTRIESGNRKCYNIFYFIFLRNIYVNSFLTSSHFAPKYKAFSKLVFLIYSLMLIISVFCAFFEMDLTVKF